MNQEFDKLEPDHNRVPDLDSNHVLSQILMGLGELKGIVASYEGRFSSQNDKIDQLAREVKENKRDTDSKFDTLTNSLNGIGVESASRRGQFKLAQTFLSLMAGCSGALAAMAIYFWSK